VAPGVGVQIERRIAELAATRAALRGLARRAAATDPAGCAGSGICSILARPAGAGEARLVKPA